MLRIARLTAALALAFGLSHGAQAAPFVGDFEDLVDAKANLYHSDWGHSYTLPIPDPYGALSPDLERIGVGTGIAPRAVRTSQAGGQPIAFTPGQSFTIEVPLWSRVIDLATNETDAFGIPWDYDFRSNPDNWNSWGFDFRGLRVYSLIGMWSTSATSLVPYNPGNNPFDQLPFLVGYGFSGLVPQYQGQLFLFMANNDGIFEDNVSSYNVFITLRGLSVSEPATMALIGGGLFMIAAARRRRVSAA